VNPNSPFAENTDDLELFKKLMQKPKLAWPTVTLLGAAFVIFGVSTYAHITERLPLGWAMFFNAVASYKDPDVYSGMGPKWLLPFRWLTLDFIYFKNYLSPDVFKKRPRKERYEFYFAILFVVSVVTAAALTGWLKYYLLLFFIPTRIAKFFIIIAFDFLPHYPHEAYAKEEPYRCTSNRVGMEWLLTPLFIYQNYHLVHHLYPAIPFYRYIKIWNSRKNYHEFQNPAITDTFSLRPR